MWNRLSSVLKSRPEPETSTTTNTDIHSIQPSTSRPANQYLSVGRSHMRAGSDHHLPLPAASPPSSPSRHGRLGLFKRSSKPPKGDANDTSSFCLPHIPLPRKRSNLQMNSKANGSTTSLRSAFDDGMPPRSSCETAIARPQTPIDSERLSMALGNGSGSVRSILRDRNTPGTGQNVRFFSRDAYRVISPDVSTTTASPENSHNDPAEPSYQQRMSQANIDLTPSTDSSNPGTSAYQSAAVTMGEPTVSRPPTPMGQFYNDTQTPSSGSSGNNHTNARSAYADAHSMSSPGVHSTKSMIVPVPPPDNSDIFDLSAAGEHGVQEIPMAPGGVALQDGAVEVDDDEEAEILGRVSSPVLKAKIAVPEKENTPPVLAPTRNQVMFAVPEANTSNPLLNTSSTSDKQKNKSLGRKAGEAIFSSLANVRSDNESKSNTIAPRTASSLGLYKIFSVNPNGSSSSISKPMPAPTAPADQSATSANNRSRAYSDRVFHRPMSIVPERPTSDPARVGRYADPNMPARPESMIDTSAVMVYPPGQTPDSSPSKLASVTSGAEMPDPFRADARTYYTPEVGVPNSPPPPKVEGTFRPQHGRSASVSGGSMRSAAGSAMSSSSYVSSHKPSNSLSVIRPGTDEDMVLALRTQLTFHQELSAQYEADLSARDELVSVLSSQLATTKCDLDARTRLAKAARQKIGQLEKACRNLERAYHEMEDEVEQSRLHSAERSVMDEASGEALRALHGVIAKLEKENERLRTDAVRVDASVRERSMNANGSGSVGLNETGMSADEMLNERLRETQEEREIQEERHRESELAWEEERGRLVTKVEELEGLQTALEQKDGEIDVLKKEVEAQWAGTERMNSSIDQLRAENEALSAQIQALVAEKAEAKPADVSLVEERDALRLHVESLREEVAAYEARINELEVGWTDGENQRSELERELEVVERERSQLQDDLSAAHKQLDQQRTELVNAESRLANSNEEAQFASENIARLENLLHERGAELSEYVERYNSQMQELEETRDQLSALRREHSRASQEHERRLAEVASREQSAHSEVEAAIRERVAMQVELETFQQRVASMEGDLEKARRQVHVLRQESADQEVKITQLKQQRDKDEDDKLGLNIALDSKQQELELVKRKMNLCGTAGSTPAIAPRIGNRRESAAFTTPMPSRPPSSQSDAGVKGSNDIDTTVTSRTTLGRTSRANSMTSGGLGKNVLPPSAIKIKAPRASEGHMLPPSSTVRPRASLSSSVSSMASSTSLSRSTTVIPRPGASGLASSTQRRQSAILSRSMSSKNALARSSSFEPGSQSDVSSVAEEKENAQPTPRASVMNATVGVKSRRMSSYTAKPMPA